MNKTISWESLIAGFLVLVLMVSGLAVCKAGSAAAASGKPYYEGKVITYMVGSFAGGGDDTVARLVSRHLGRHIPGKPAIVVRNIPAGGGIINGNQAWSSKPDGLTVLAVGGKELMSNILRLKGIEYRLEEGYPIYAEANGCVYFVKPGIIKEPKDIVKAKGLVYGGSDPTAGPPSGFIWAKELLGFQTDRIVMGYGGDAPSRLAFVSGETNFCGQSTAGYNAGMPAYVEKGEAVVVFQTGLFDAKGDVVREAAAPNVPTIKELYEQIFGKPPAGLAWEAFANLIGSRTVGKCQTLPPQTPKQCVEIVTKAAAEMVKDPKFLEEAEKLSPGATRFVGKDLLSPYRLGVSGRPEVVEYMKKIYIEKYNLRFD